jgi:predicted porin
MKFARALSVLLLFTSPLALADAFDISLNNNAIAASYSLSAAALIQGNSDVNAGILYNDSMNSLADIGLLVKGDDGEGAAMTLGVGAKALVGMIKNYIPGTTQNLGSIVIGGELGFAFPTAKQLSAGFYYFAGPKITTFGDANRANDWGLHLDYEVSPGTKVYIEYREVNFGIISTGKTATLDSGTYMGVRMTF